MDYQKLVDKKDYVQKNFEKIAIDLREKYENDFKLNYNHHSTAIENNTITLKETKLILTGELTNIDKNSREINEITNHNQAFNYIKNCINEQKKLSEDNIKEI